MQLYAIFRMKGIFNDTRKQQCLKCIWNIYVSKRCKVLLQAKYAIKMDDTTLVFLFNLL